MKKTVIVYGALDTAVQKRALEELTAIILDYTLDYPICEKFSEDIDKENARLIYIGTKQNNPYIDKNSKFEILKPESYGIEVKNDTVIIEGFDDAGVLYGVLDFYNKYVVNFEYPEKIKYWVNVFEADSLPDFELTSSPTTQRRGLWTWGHVIYDYRDYLHNMMKLKMNEVIIWNDFAPANAKEIVEYAHTCNIKVIWGFAWLWDVHCDVVDLKKLEGEPEKIFAKYEHEYADKAGDGIYFQTFTELDGDNIGGVMIAEAAMNFVNKTAALFYEKYPDLEIQFGLHATSVKNKLEFIAGVDQRIRIVWENCGAFPFAWIPACIGDFEETKEFVGKIANLRGEDDKFGVVTKGLVMLDWSNFKHLKGPQCIGVSSELVKKNRIERKSRIWRYIQSGWMINSDKVHEMIQKMCHLKKGSLSAYALVEDGMFEENIMYPVAIYSEMLWNCDEDLKVIMKEVALRAYVTFA